MKLRAVRPSAIGAVDTIVVPLGADGTTPAGLARAVKTVVDRIAKAEVGAGRLYGVTTQHAEPRIVVTDQGGQVVVMPLDEFNSWKETLYLLSNPANAAHLRRSIAQANSGQAQKRELSPE